MTFTPAEIEYLRTQPLGRLATVGRDGVVQVNPVGYRVDADGTITVGGHSMSTTRKFRNVAATGRAALVVDDLVARDPWTVRGVEVRGRAEAVAAGDDPVPGSDTAVIRLHPDTVFTWGIDPDTRGMTRRIVDAARDRG